jgi:hypothetical protein
MGRRRGLFCAVLELMDAAQLARELARRMRAVVPPRIHISVEGATLRFSHSLHGGRAGTYGCQWLYRGVGEEAHLIAQACRLSLSDLQDFVAESTTEAWPGSAAMPDPGARVEDGRVLLWFGEEDDPVVVLEPLPLNP